MPVQKSLLVSVTQELDDTPEMVAERAETIALGRICSTLGRLQIDAGGDLLTKRGRCIIQPTRIGPPEIDEVNKTVTVTVSVDRSNVFSVLPFGPE